MADPDKGAKKRLRAAARATLKRTKRTPAATDAQATRMHKKSVFVFVNVWLILLVTRNRAKWRFRRITYKNVIMCDFSSGHCGTVTGSLIGCPGTTDPPRLRSRNSWQIPSNWDSKARPFLLAVGVGFLFSGEEWLAQGYVPPLHGMIGECQVSWCFLVLVAFASNKNAYWQLSRRGWFGSACYPASLFLMTFTQFPLCLTFCWDSPTPAQKLRSRAQEILLSHPTMFDGWTSGCRGLGPEICHSHSQFLGQKLIGDSSCTHQKQVDDIFQYPRWPPTMRLKMNSGMMVNNIAYCSGWSVWSMSWS